MAVSSYEESPNPAICKPETIFINVCMHYTIFCTFDAMLPRNFGLDGNITSSELMYISQQNLATESYNN